MSALSTHTYSARVLDPVADIDLSLRESNPGTISLDAGGVPHVEGSLTFAVEDAMLLEQLDPRDARRLVVNTHAELSDSITDRPFDLGIRRATPNRGEGTVTLDLASDEALLTDFAQLVDDSTPRTYEYSIRTVCEYVLSRVPGVQRNLNPYPLAGTGSGWNVGSWGTGGAGNIDVNGTTGVNPIVPNSPQPAMRFSWTTAPTGGNPSFDTGIFAIPTDRPTMTFSMSVSAVITGQVWQLLVQWLSPTALISVTSGDAIAPHLVNGRYSVTARPPAGATRARITMRLAAGSPSNQSYGWISLATAVVGLRTSYVERAIEPGVDTNVTAYWRVTNRAKNSGLRSVATGYAAGTGTSAVARSTTTTFNGIPTMSFTAAGTDVAFLNTASSGVSVTPGRPLTFRYSIQSTGTGRASRSMLRFRDAAGSIVKEVYSAPLVTGATPVTISLVTVVPEGASTVDVFVSTMTNAAGQVHYAGMFMLYEGIELVNWFDGASALTGYTVAWENPSDTVTSLSTRTPILERLPEALTWRAGVSAMDFLQPLLMASGLRIVCDEQRRWTLRDANYRETGDQSYRYAVDIESADETLSRDDDAWFDAAVYEYVWTDTAGVEQRRTDAWSLRAIPTKVLRREINSPFPGVGRAESIVRRAQGRGRTVTVSAIPTWDERTDQTLSVLLEGTPIQTGIVASVRFDFGNDTVTVSSRTTDTPAAAWALIPAGQRWIDSPAGGTWKNEVI